MFVKKRSHLNQKVEKKSKRKKQPTPNFHSIFIKIERKISKGQLKKIYICIYIYIYILYKEKLE